MKKLSLVSFMKYSLFGSLFLLFCLLLFVQFNGMFLKPLILIFVALLAFTVGRFNKKEYRLTFIVSAAILAYFVFEGIIEYLLLVGTILLFLIAGKYSELINDLLTFDFEEEVEEDEEV